MKKYVFLAILAYMFIINVLAFLLMLIDKKKSKRRHSRRIPEALLLSIAYLGGSIGIMAAMEIFRHKTRHKRFSVSVPLSLIVQVAVAGAFYFLIF